MVSSATDEHESSLAEIPIGAKRGARFEEEHTFLFAYVYVFGTYDPHMPQHTFISLIYVGHCPGSC